MVAAGTTNSISNNALIDLVVGDHVWVAMSTIYPASLAGTRTESGVGNFYHTTFTGFIVDSVFDTC